MDFITKIKKIIDSKLEQIQKENIDYKKLIKETEIEYILDEKFKNIKSHINYKDLTEMTDNEIILEILNTYFIINDILVVREEYIEQIEESIDLELDYYYDDSLKSYLYEIKKYRLLTLEQEKELIKLNEIGYPEARKKLIEHNLRLVVNVAKKYVGNGFDFMDLIEEGNIGLIKAIDKYKSSFNTKISTYAVYWIHQCITRAIDEKSRLIRIPVGSSQKLKKLEKVKQKLKEQYNREATLEELVKETKFSEDTIKLLCEMSITPLSLEKPIDEEEDETLSSIVVDVNQQIEETVFKEYLKEYIYDILNSLTKREKEIIIKRYGIGISHGMTLEEIGKELNLTCERVRQIEEKALRKLRHPRNTKHIKDYNN